MSLKTADGKTAHALLPSKATAFGDRAIADAFGLPLNDDELLANAARVLTEAEMIAERGSMLIWLIEAALERTALCRAKFQMTNDKSQIELAQLHLDKAKQLVKQTEKPYEPHVPDGEDWEPPAYIGVFKQGEIVGYHCRNDEIERLQAAIDSASGGR